MAEQMFNSSQSYMIGGPGLTDEVDESMFGNSFLQNFSLFHISIRQEEGVEYL